MKFFKKSNFTVVILALLMLSGCTYASDKAVSIAQDAIDVVDGYLDGDISAGDTYDKLDELYAKMDYVDDMEHGDEHYSADFGIKISILGLSVDMGRERYDGGDIESYDEIKEKRNELAKEAGLKKR